MNHNLTPNQLEALKWLVQHVRSGKLEETFEAVEKPGGGLFLPDVRGEKLPDYMNPGALAALQIEGTLRIVSKGKDNIKYVLAGKAYQLADS